MNAQPVSVRTSSRSQWVDITDKVAEVVAASGVQSGMCYVFVQHTTAGVTINENADPDVQRDVQAVLSRLVPPDDGYAHAEGNSDAHAKASLMGFTAAIPVEQGRLQLGTWQGIYFCEFDGPRSRQALVKVVDC